MRTHLFRKAAKLFIESFIQALGAGAASLILRYFFEEEKEDADE